MKKIRYIGMKPCTIKLIDGGIISHIQPGQVLTLLQKDFDSLIDLSSRLPSPEWQEVI